MLHYKNLILCLSLSSLICASENPIADLKKNDTRPKSALPHPACAPQPSQRRELAVPAIAESEGWVEGLNPASHVSSQTVEPLETNTPLVFSIGPEHPDYTKCDPCCNASCKPSKTCVKGWTCVATAGPPFCATTLLCTALQLSCIPCIIAMDKDKKDNEPAWLEPLHFLCTPPIPEKKEEHEFLHALCRLPACWPCATFFCFPHRVMCKEFFCR